MPIALVNGRVLAGEEVREGQAVLVQDGLIQAIVPEAEVPGDAVREDLGGALLLPGFVDLQVNGGGGVLFNESPTPEAIAAIGQAHRRFGTTKFLPTLISDDLEVIRDAFAAVRTCRDPGVLGVHIEGPFLSAERKGIHDRSKFRTLDEQAIALLVSPNPGKTLVTLAPEKTTPAMIRRLVDAGVIVSAGHTNASYAETRAALDGGLTGFTHLFNAMSPLTSREPGVVGAALEDPQSWCGLIVDGRHVHPATLKLAHRCKPRGKLMLVTDAMPCVGSAESSFVLQGQTIRVENGVCVGADGTLAGSNLDMASAVRNAVELMGVGLAEAVRMASAYPADFLGLGHRLGRIAPGYVADLVLADDGLNVLETWVDGRSSGQADSQSVADGV
jgi:N-acetylglucosamine-6-phosphate deacetylase